MTISTNEDIVFIVKFGTLNCHEEVWLFLSVAAAALFMTSDAIVKCYVPSRRRKDLPFKYYWVLNTPMALAVLARGTENYTCKSASCGMGHFYFILAVNNLGRKVVTWSWIVKMTGFTRWNEVLGLFFLHTGWSNPSDRTSPASSSVICGPIPKSF